MSLFKRLIRAIDSFQQRHTGTSFVYGVVKKYGDDNVGSLVVQLTYSMFITIFPLLLLLITVLGVVLANDPRARESVANSAFGEFPIVGAQLSSNIHALKTSSVFGLVVGALGLVYGSTGLAQSGLFSMAQIWGIPPSIRPGYLARLVRSLIFLVVLGVGLIVTTGLSSFGTFGRHDFVLGVLAELLAACVNVGLYLAAFRTLTPKQVERRSLVPGAVVGGIAWTVLQAFGGYVVGHDLKGASETYGLFGVVLGLLAWIYLGAQITLYAAELNTVLRYRLWPRALSQPPSTEADQRTAELRGLESEVSRFSRDAGGLIASSITEEEFKSRVEELGHPLPHTIDSTEKQAD